MTKVISCSCSHEYQDRKYGRGQRVHNYTPKGESAKMMVWRCTICETEHTSGRLSE